MRISSISIENVGGLPNGRIVLPEGSVAALAGANGTGKSKLLACILAPWSGQLPSPQGELEAKAVVEFHLAPAERESLSQFSNTAGWGSVDLPEIVNIGVRRGPVIGMQRIVEPDVAVLHNFWSYAEFFPRNPSLNVVYLPAERRLIEPRQQGIDLNQLSEQAAYERNAESRNAVANYGRLDDREFEDFAKALCVASTLPGEGGEIEGTGGGLQWEAFQATVNALIAPKELLPLTRQHPDQLRIKTAAGDVHSVRDLSSGERQALIIISRVLRAGSTTPLVLIDEPDAYLHPHLAKRLILALEDGVGPDGQLIVATHSPAVLDGIPPSAIMRMEYDSAPAAIADETERLELYRAAGFRSSALTQSNLLVITEGATDGSLLNLALPQLSSASIHSAGGKRQVLAEVDRLAPFELPVLGIVDRDVNPIALPIAMLDNVFVWPTADIEGLYLGDDALKAMLDAGLLKARFRSTDELQSIVDNLCIAQRENVIAELARESAVRMSGYEWPSPRGDNALRRLREAVGAARPIAPAALDAEIEKAERTWDQSVENLLQLVRGKYVLSAFASEASEMKSGRALIEAAARLRPPIPAMLKLGALIDARLQSAPR